MGIFDILHSLFGGHSKYSGVIRKCPNCGVKIDISKERCPNCGVHISSMFRKKCPRCKASNKLDAKFCVKCGYSFSEEHRKNSKKRYRCPICGYSADYYMLKCPVCGARFS